MRHTSIMSQHQRAVDGNTRRCPECQEALAFTRRPRLTHQTPSVRTGIELHDGTDRIEYDAAWVCQNPKCHYRERV